MWAQSRRGSSAARRAGIAGTQMGARSTVPGSRPPRTTCTALLVASRARRRRGKIKGVTSFGRVTPQRVGSSPKEPRGRFRRCSRPLFPARPERLYASLQRLPRRLDQRILHFDLAPVHLCHRLRVRLKITGELQALLRRAGGHPSFFGYFRNFYGSTFIVPLSLSRLHSPRTTSSVPSRHSEASPLSRGVIHAPRRMFIRDPKMLCRFVCLSRAREGVTPLLDRGYAGSWMQTSENCPSTHSGE